MSHNNLPLPEWVLIHLCYSHMTDHSRSPSRTSVISISKDTTLDGLKTKVDSMYKCNRFDILGKVQASEFWDNEVVDKVFSIKWAGNAGVPDMQLVGDYETQKAFLSMKARCWKNHLVLRCRLKKNMKVAGKEKEESVVNKGGRQGGKGAGFRKGGLDSLSKA